MTSAAAAIPTSLDNPEEWDEIVRAITSETGLAPTITPAAITALVGSALPLLFQVDVSDLSPLRGTFSNEAIAERAHGSSSFQGIRPSSAVVHLVGAPPGDDARPLLRIHLAISSQGADGQASVTRQFWDLAISAQASAAAPPPPSSCSNCGAPLTQGQLFCSHCGTDMRSAVAATLTVVKLQLY